MKPKDTITIFLLLFVVFSLGFMLGRETQPRDKAAPGKSTAAEIKKPSTKYVVYYFYNGKRCVTCKNIENYTEQTVVRDFSQSLVDRRITFFPVNIDQKNNEHFIDDFNLTTKTVVLAEYKDNKCVKSKQLGKIWELAHDKKLFDAYVREEISAFSGLKK